MLIAGPTASGKSALALEKAIELGGVIVNTDSMQVYDVLNVLTARPSAKNLAQAPHYLYGHAPPSVRFSTGTWLTAISEVSDLPDVEGKPLIFVGGTGLYFQALINGFNATPEVPAAIFQQWNDRVAGLDREGRKALLDAHDPKMSARMREPDPQRVVRVLSVMEATGRSLADWQDVRNGGLLSDASVEKIVLNPDRELLRHRIAARFEWMFDNGAVEETQALLALGLPGDLPAMKAIGVAQIGAWLNRELSRDEAIELSVNATRQYSKRQRTWFRKQMADWEWRS